MSKEESSAAVLDEVDAAVKKPRSAYIETYFEVVFSPRSNPAEPQDVELLVNGECLQVQRGKKAVVPARFLEAADHAQYQQFSQLPNETRKVVANISSYPYTKIRPATEVEYQAQKREGNRILAESLRLKESAE